MDKDINNNIDIDEDEDENEDVEEIIEPNTYIGDNNEYMNEYDEEEKEYYSAQWFKKEYNTDGLYNNIVVKSKKKTFLSMRWLIQSARERNEKTMQERLMQEIIAASNGEGNAIKKKKEVHKRAEANKAFSHLKI